MIVNSPYFSLGEKRMTHRHKVAGTVTVDGQPARRLVVAFDRMRMVFMGATFSDPATGAWQISGIGEIPVRTMIVFSLDSTGNYNAEVADFISQIATVGQ